MKKTKKPANSKHKNDDVTALIKVIKALMPLNHDARKRILEYLSARFKDS